MNSPYTTLGLPPDGVAWAALVGAALLVPILYGPSRRRLGLDLTSHQLLPVLSACAVLLSIGYVAYYLRSGPRIIDATSYFLQARAMAKGFFAFPIAVPYGSFGGRFLLASEPHRLAVIFPPGYAALLALGFWARAPMLVGPVLGGLIVLVTYALARELSGRRDVACVAACLSVLCATLRYHTADTMSHGLCALLLCAGIWRALRALRHDAALSGLALGWLFATRPISGLVGVAIALCLLDRRLWRLGWFGLGLVPGVTLFFFYQRAATGSFWSSTQLSYYAVADGPPGCFRYGFGSGIGCLFEHGEYVRARLTGGYGFREAARVTLGRLAVHSIDVANMAPLSVLCIVGAWLARGQRGVRAIFFGCLAFMLAYTPFYFDGSYPGGGARLFADLLPLEHVLLAIALVRLEWYVAALPLSLIGFACHASFAHRALSEREGGRPMFEAPVLARAGVDHGLVFVDTDHGWNLGHDPAQFDAQTQIVVARYEHDAHDWLLWNRLDRPRSYRYLYSTAERLAEPRLVPYTPTKTLRFEAEAEWPPLGVSNGWARPDFFPCASGGRALRLQPSGPQATMALEWEFALADAAPHHLWLGWVRTTGQAAEVRLTLAGGSRAFGAIPAGATECVEVDLGWVELSSAVTTARLESSAAGMFDYVEVRP